MKRAWKAIGFVAALTAMYRNADDVHLPHSVGTGGTIICGLMMVVAIVVISNLRLRMARSSARRQHRERARRSW